MYPHLEYQWIDRRSEIERYERKHRPFPPRSGSVSKPRQSTEPDEHRLYAEWAEPGIGKPIYYTVRTYEKTPLYRD